MVSELVRRGIGIDQNGINALYLHGSRSDGKCIEVRGGLSKIRNAGTQ